MNYFLSESGSSGRNFDNLKELLDAISELASTYAEDGEDWFEVAVTS